MHSREERQRLRNRKGPCLCQLQESTKQTLQVFTTFQKMPKTKPKPAPLEERFPFGLFHSLRNPVIRASDPVNFRIHKTCLLIKNKTEPPIDAATTSLVPLRSGSRHGSKGPPCHPRPLTHRSAPCLRTLCEGASKPSSLITCQGPNLAQSFQTVPNSLRSPSPQEWPTFGQPNWESYRPDESFGSGR